MQYCFSRITDLPLSSGEKLEHFISGLNPALKLLVVTAPSRMGCNGKWLDPNQLMFYTVMQAQLWLQKQQARPHWAGLEPA